MKCLLLYSLSISLLFTAVSCSKNKETDLKPILNAANDIILVQRPFIFAFNLLVKASLDSALQANYHANIDSSAVVLNPGKKKYTFSFTGKLCPDSVIRFGYIQAILDTNLFIPGSKVKIVFNYYSEDSHGITADDSLLNEGPLPGGELIFKNMLSGVSISKDITRNIKWEGSFNFHVQSDIIYHGTKKAVITVDGSGQGTSSMGYLFYSSIASSLRDSLDCPWPKDGIINFYMPEVEPKNGSIEFMAKKSCNNHINYNFDGVLYEGWISDKYLIK
ncbi:MAG: hypothetical protein WCO93_00255 [bacterium]